jgi:hypothetical protein
VRDIAEMYGFRLWLACKWADPPSKESCKNVVSEDNSELEQARIFNPLRPEKGGYGLITVRNEYVFIFVFSYEHYLSFAV